MLVAVGTALLGSLLSSFFLYIKFSFFNFPEWFGTVFLLLSWYTLFIPSTMEFVIPGKWVNATQLVGFIAADLFLLLIASNPNRGMYETWHGAYCVLSHAILLLHFAQLHMKRCPPI